MWVFQQAKVFAYSFKLQVENFVSTVVSDVQKTFKQSFSFINSIYHQPHFRQAAHQHFLQTWRGFSQVFNLNWMTSVMESENIRQVLSHTLPANYVSYLGPVFIYEIYSKMAKYYFPLPKNEITDLAANIYFTRIAIRMFVDNTTYNLSMAQAVMTAHPISEYDDKPCECRTIPILRAGLASSFYYVGNSAAIYVISCTLPFGQYMAIPLRALLYGQNFLEYKLSAIGMCTKHRYQKLNCNNAYALGMGLSFLGILKLYDFSINYFVGIGLENFFIYDVFFSLLFQHYIMLALLLDRKLPGEQLGVDFFYYSRFITQSILKQCWGWVGPLFLNQLFKDKMTNYLSDFLLFPPVRLLKNIFIEKDLLSSDLFFKRSAIKLYIELNGKKIKDTLDYVISLRNKTYAKSVSYLVDYLPEFFFSNSEKKMMNLLFEQKIENILLEINQFVNILNESNKKEYTVNKKINDLDSRVLIEYSPIKKEEKEEKEELEEEIDFEVVKAEQAEENQYLQQNSFFSFYNRKTPLQRPMVTGVINKI